MNERLGLLKIKELLVRPINKIVFYLVLHMVYNESIKPIVLTPLLENQSADRSQNIEVAPPPDRPVIGLSAIFSTFFFIYYIF